MLPPVIPLPICPDCGCNDVRSLGALPEGVSFAGRIVPAPLPGGDLFRCGQCDLRWRWPPLPEYTPLYDNACVSAWSLGPMRVDQQLVLTALEALPRGGHVLDFGCYRGEFLARLPPRFARYGVEVSRAAAALAAEHAEARVVERLDEFETALRFDVIVAMDVIEHVHSPRAMLAQWLERLAPGGSVFVTTGDGGAVLWRLVGSRWWYCYFPEHIAFISRPWLRFHLPQIGARLQAVRTFRYVDERAGVLKRWQAWLRYLLRPGHYARKRKRCLALEGRDIGVPGSGLSPDHLLVQIVR